MNKKKLLKLPGAKREPRLTHDEGVWFRERYLVKDDECRQLRRVIAVFAHDLETGGLSDRLLAQELRSRASKIPSR